MATTTKSGSDTGLNKSQAIRDYLAEHPDAAPKDVVAGLGEKGLVVTPGLVGLVKHSSRKQKETKAKAKPARTPARRGRKLKSASAAPAAATLSKSDAVRAYLSENPGASPNTVRDALREQGIKISTSLAASVKYSKASKGLRRKAGKRGPGRPRIASLHGDGALDLEALVDAKRLAERLGGIDAAREALDWLAKLA